MTLPQLAKQKSLTNRFKAHAKEWSTFKFRFWMERTKLLFVLLLGRRWAWHQQQQSVNEDSARTGKVVPDCTKPTCRSSAQHKTPHSLSRMSQDSLAVQHPPRPFASPTSFAGLQVSSYTTSRLLLHWLRYRAAPPVGKPTSKELKRKKDSSRLLSSSCSLS